LCFDGVLPHSTASALARTTRSGIQSRQRENDGGKLRRILRLFVVAFVEEILATHIIGPMLRKMVKKSQSVNAAGMLGAISARNCFALLFAQPPSAA
jgi:hypothetical protein